MISPVRYLASGVLLTIGVSFYAVPASADPPPSKPSTPAKSAKGTVPAVDTAEPVVRLTLPASASAALQAGDRSMRGGDFDDAARSYVQAALAAPGEPLLRMVAGVALGNIRQLPEAAKQFERAVGLADDDLIAALQYQGALVELGDSDRAQSVYLDAVRRFTRPSQASAGMDASRSITRLRGALAAFPDSPILHLLLGDAYQMQEKWVPADTEYRRAIALAPTWAKPRVNYGLSRLAQGKTAEAIQTFQAALERDPTNSQARMFKADALRESGRNDAAIRDYQRLEQDPKFRAQAVTGIAQAYAANGQLPQALENGSRAQKIAPNDAATQAAFADIQAKAGNFDAAAEGYERALRLTKEEGLFGTQAVLYRALAETQLARHNADAALATIGKALADEPGSSALWHRLAAQAYLDKSDDVRAEGEFKAALDADASLYPYETLHLIEQWGMLIRIARSYQADLDAVENGGVRIGNNSGSGTRGGGGAAADAANSAGSRTGSYTSPSVSGGGFGGGGGGFFASPPVVMIGPAPAASLTPDGQARSHVALAALARYRGDFNEEVRRRESVTRLRSRALDFYLLGEAADRASNSAKSLPAYQRALNLGGLPEALAAKARARVSALSGATR